MKWWPAVVTIALVAAGLSGQQPTKQPAKQTETVTVQLLAINDLHGNLEPPAGADGMVGGVPAGGVEYLATHLRLAADSNLNTLVVGAGDMMGASPLLSAAFHDEPTIESLNAMHLALTPSAITKWTTAL